MPIDRASDIKLGSFVGVAAVAGACHYFELGDEKVVTLFGTVLTLLGSGAHALVGHPGVDLLGKIAGHGGPDHARGEQNRDLHRLIGETIARILERESDRALSPEHGANYLRSAAAAFRNNWMAVDLTGPQTDVGESSIPAYFTGDAELIKKAPVLEPGEWVALVENVAGPATLDEYRALDHAAAKLREHFAFELWEAAKDAWKKDDLAWPALILRLLSLILGHAGDAARNAAATAGQMTELRQEVTMLRDAIDGAVARVAPDKLPGNKEMLAAIRHYQDDLDTNLSRMEQRLHEDIQTVLDKVADVKAALENPRVAPVKEPLINFPNTTKQILARDWEARQLLDALSPDGPGIVSIAAPPGFGKSAVLALALRMALPNRDPGQAGLSGIAVLDARATLPGIASFANLLDRITGLQEIAARFTAAADHPDANVRALFFDFLRQAGKVWLVVENAEAVLAPTAPNGAADDFQDLLKAWCQTGHQAKLLMLTRHALHAAPECHRHLRDVEEALLGGLPEDSAVELLSLRLADTRFRTTRDSLLRQIARKLHRVPMALEQFAGYLHLNEQGVDLTSHSSTGPICSGWGPPSGWKTFCYG